MKISKKYSILKYFLKARIAESFNSFDRCIRNYSKLVFNDLDPVKKKVDYEKLILELAEKIFRFHNVELESRKIISDTKKILILNSEIYDTGGHTETAIRYIEAFKNQYSITFFLAGFKAFSAESAPLKSVRIKNMVDAYIEYGKELSYDERIIRTYQYIIENNIKTVNSNIHMYDVVGCAVLGLLKKYTDVRIIYWNHGDHYFALGTRFADKILTRCKNGKAITPYLSENKNVVSYPFLMNDSDDIQYSAQELNDFRSKIGIPGSAFVTLTGCPLYKIDTEYFELIRGMLDKYSNIYHILVSTLRGKERDRVLRFFKDTERFVLIDFVPDFDRLIQMTDLYVDSFPQGSALTLVDYIKNAKPVLIKVNKENPIKSFEEYLYPGYEYACNTVDEMLDGIGVLSNNKAEYLRVSEKVKNYYETNYALAKVKPLYEQLI